MSAENILIDKLNEFIRKYYKNKIIRGALISLGILLSLYLLEIFLEYFNYFPSLTRIILLYFYLTVSVICLGFFIVIPGLKYLRIGKLLSYEQAAVIIGKHFSEIQDKLLNTLQLVEQKSSANENVDLLVASIEQRIRSIKPFYFSQVINLKKNIRYLKYALPPLLILILLLLIAPSMVSDPTKRLFRYNEKFSPPTLFRILILNKELKVMQQEDLTLQIEIVGSEIPEELFIKSGNSTFPMKRDGSTRYSYVFKALQSETKFRFIADEKESEEHTIAVYPKPIILNFETRIEYPAYTGKQNEILNNIGDLIVPEGTLITWNVYTRDVTNVLFRLGSEEIKLQKKNSNVFSFSKKLMESTRYSLFQENEFSKSPDSLSYSVTVIKDAFPEITVSETSDTGNTSKLFFQGTIKDDYGFTKLLFNFSGKEQNDSASHLLQTENIAINKMTPSQVYFYALDLSTVKMNPGDKYTFYFEIWDNDGIRGPKSSRTKTIDFEIPSIEKIAESTNKNAENIQKELNQSLNESREIKKSIDDINRRMIDQNEVSWKEKKKLEELIKSNENIQKQVQEFKLKNEQNLKNEKQFLETSERILEKQKKLNELADQLLPEEMKKAIQEMKSLLNQIDKDKLNQLLPKFEKLNENLEKELDRNLQLFKQIEFERKLEQNANQLKKLADEQEKLAIQTESQKKPTENIIKEQKEIKNAYDSISKSLEELQKQSGELENVPDLKSTESARESINKQMNKNEELIKAQKSKDASKNQKTTAQEMNDLAQTLQNMQEETDEEAQEEDAGALKLLLQNLNKLSFQQEDLIDRTMNINRNDPKYLALIEDQKQIRDKFNPIEDTLNRIARREVMMKSIITKEISTVKDNLSSSERSLEERVLQMAMAKQQYAMTSMNNLAVMLDEALTQMNQQIDEAKMSKGQKQCKKPGKPGGKKSMNSLRQMQEEMSKKLDKLKEDLGRSKGNKNPTRSEEEGTSRDIAQMVAEQEAIRQALQEYENAMKEQGIKDMGNLNSILEEMEKNEGDILNKRVDQETISRQQRIVTRMLESEKAEQKREKEERRESTEAKNQIISNPGANFEYNKSKNAGKELINFTPAPVNYYYKSKASEYILKIEK